MKSFFFILIFLVLQVRLFAQLYHIKNYSKDEGLPQLQVFCIEQDSYGFLWFGTAYGLARYDGHEFINYGLESGLPDVEVIALCEGDSNHIWVGTALGLCRFDRNPISNAEVKFKTYLPLERILFLCYDNSKKQLWITTKSGAIYTYKEGNLKQVHKAAGPLNWVFKNTDGTIWIIGAEGLYTFLPDGKFLYYYHLNFDSYPVASLASGAKEILILTNRSLYQFDTRKGHLISHPLNRHINSGGKFTFLEIDSDSTLWIGCDDGVWKVDKTLTHITKKNGLVGNLVRCIKEDREGNIWVGTYTAGVSKIISTDMIGFGMRSGLDFSVSSCIIQTKSQGILVGTDRGIKKFKDYHISDPEWASVLKQKDIWVLREDYQNNIWAGISHGLYRFKPTGNGYRLVDIHLKDRIIFNLFEDSRKRLWIACDGYLYYYNQNRFEEIDFLRNYSLGNVWTITETHDGILWIGTAAGLVSYDDNKTRYYSDENGLSGHGVNVIYEDRQHQLWIGTDLALYRYQEGEFKIASGMEHVNGRVITDITEDENGLLWICTDKGINVYDGQKVIRQLGKIDGLIGDEFTTDNSILLDDSGKVWVAVFGGITIFNPYVNKKHKPSPRVVITRTLASNNQENTLPLAIQEGDEIPFDLNILTFRFTGLSFTNEESVSYRTFLQGFDKGWSEWSGRMESRYTNLYPGSYTLQIECRNSYGIVSESPANFNFTVAAPFWLTKIFIISMIFFLIGAIYLIVLYKTKSIQRRNRQLEEKVSERTRELLEAKEYVENIIENFGDMIMTVNKNMKILTWNSAAQRIFGFSKRDIITKSISVLDQDSDGTKFTEIIKEFEKRGAIHEMEIQKRTRNRDKKELLVSVNHLKNPFGTVDGYTFVVSDVSEKNKLNKELLNREKLLGSIEALQKLLGTLSHHINNSVTAMYGMAQLSAQDNKYNKKLVSTTQEQTKRIRAVLQSLSKLVREMNLKTVNYAGGEEQIYDIGMEIDSFLTQLNVDKEQNNS